MENYKIKVNNEAESKEAQELFFELGYNLVNNIACEKGFVVASLYSSGINFDYWDDVKETTIAELRDLVAAHRKPTEQGLISGADALRALADGEEVELQAVGDMNWYESTQWTVGELLRFKGSFRIKPRTIKLELEIPAPFDVQEGEKAYRLAPAIPCGYTELYFEEDEYEHQFGAWRTEEEIKQVVAALRGAINNG